MPPKYIGPGPNPSGLCMCGCGEPTPLSSYSHRALFRAKDQPIRYLPGHHRRKSPVEYVVEDRGHETPCWIWQRAMKGSGYGNGWRNGRSVAAHIIFYERAHGPVPQGLELDHLCRVPSCVNPDHLEPVTHQENVLRGNAPCAVVRRTGVCTRGHEMTPENTNVDTHGRRTCRICLRASWRRYDRAKRAAGLRR
jgi:hypothetical protein